MIEIKRNKKKDNEFSFKANFTAGKILAIKHALKEYQNKSLVANDVYYLLLQAIEVSGESSLKGE